MKRLYVLFASWTVFAFALSQTASAQDWFVTTNGTGTGSSWASPTNSIQGAIDAAAVGVTVWVSNGVYNTGGITNYPAGSLLTNRIAITKAITVRSANNDPTNTIIKGQWHDPTTRIGPAAVRCVYMAANSTLIGFTLTNGATKAGWGADEYGGGVRADAGGTVSNCIMANNSCWGFGGGMYGGTLYNCTLSGNYGYWYGGGASASIMYNCTLTGNSAGAGGGVYGGTLYNCLLAGNAALHYAGAMGGGGARDATLYNCTLVGNMATYSGGGTYGGNFKNCILYFNTAASGSNWYSVVSFTNCCTTPTNDLPGTGNTANDPRFIDNGTNYGLNYVAGNCRLSTPKSPCVNTGTNMPWMTSWWGRVDLDGNPRIRRGTVDMGAYEYYLRTGMIISL